MANGAEGADRNRITVVIRGKTRSTNGKRDDIDAIVDGGVHRGEDVGIEATSSPANLVHGDAGVGGHAAGETASVREEAGVGNGGAGGGGGCMGSMALSVQRGFRFTRFINRMP